MSQWLVTGIRGDYLVNVFFESREYDEDVCSEMYQ